MGDLTCGDGGSTGSEIITDINANTNANAASVVRLDAIDARLDTNRFFGAKIAAFTVPLVYNAIDDITLTTPVLPAGRYLVSYANQYNFNAVKDKSIAYQLTGAMAGVELTQSMSTGGQGSIEDSNYSFYKDLPDGSITFGMKFRTFDGTDHGFVVDFCDLMLLWVGDTPTP